jgi:hypothetical protein
MTLMQDATHTLIGRATFRRLDALLRIMRGAEVNRQNSILIHHAVGVEADHLEKLQERDTAEPSATPDIKGQCVFFIVLGDERDTRYIDARADGTPVCMLCRNTQNPCLSDNFLGSLALLVHAHAVDEVARRRGT